MVIKIIFIFALFFTGLAFMSISCFHNSPCFCDFNTAIRAQFALLFNDDLYRIYGTIINDSRNNMFLVFLYILCNWLLFVALMLRMFISVVTTAVHYIRFLNNNKNQTESIQNFLEKERKKKTKKDDDEEETNEKENHTDMLIALNHLALVNSSNIHNEKALLNFYKNKSNSNNCNETLNESILEYDDIINLHKMNSNNEFNKNNISKDNNENVNEINNDDIQLLCNNSSSHNINIYSPSQNGNNENLENYIKMFNIKQIPTDIGNLNNKEKIANQFLQEKLNKEYLRKIEVFNSKKIFSEIILKDVDHTLFYITAIKQFFKFIHRELNFLEKYSNNDNALKIMANNRKLKSSIPQFSKSIISRVETIMIILEDLIK